MNPYESIVERRTELVFPQDANVLGTLFGGKAVAMMDEVGAIVAMRACRKAVVTASIDRIDFKEPIRVGEFVEVVARIVKVGRTSLTAQVELWAEEPASGRRRLSATGSFVFVAVDRDGRPTPIRD
ncbi:MAG TPA: acyl-CoA thioesterase [Candidatus Baltobacteraceae bacterium]|nr:acyl-CoA thioesterase [Candidatus Baltobacteraceae bacterium]